MDERWEMGEMTTPDENKPDPAGLIACLIARAPMEFLVGAEIQEAVGENWTTVELVEAQAFLRQAPAQSLELAVLAVGQQDEHDPTLVEEAIVEAEARGITVIIVAEELGAVTLHHLLRLGADCVIPYPLPSGDLAAAMKKALRPKPASSARDKRAAEGTIIALQGVAGGVGTTTLATNLAWELADMEDLDGPSVCLIDLNHQFGSVASYLNLREHPATFDIWNETGPVGQEEIIQAFQPVHERLFALVAPSEPTMGGDAVPPVLGSILNAVRNRFDYVIVDLPQVVTSASMTLLDEADLILAVLNLDRRSSRNTVRLTRLLRSMGHTEEKMRYVLNRAPGVAELNARARVRRLAEGLGIAIEATLPDFGENVIRSNDQGVPLALFAPDSPLRLQLQALARDLNRTEGAGHRAA
ncbi:pilus assembly protein CpaE [Poseidonocella pacifica]|uniref:Pilus assembly protein CpaE n=1 Tax=Poseidonocella pacifica TaxID=871651 RepID=A0A1I0XDU9_9RHOB|nr:AAA family ATPase [Poseidonocella pacifica]SFA99195.1 pilus assembly protein CpaE [Poseidonocella pacifica]